jgi:agmatine deiminase
MKSIVYIVLAFFVANQNVKAQRVPAEWEPQEGIIFTWFAKDLVKGLSVDSVHLKMVKSLLKENKLIINVKNNKHKERIISLLSKNQIPIDNIIFRNATFSFPLGNYPRDYGPEWLYDSSQSLSVVDMNWSFYGYLSKKNLLNNYLNKPIKRYDKQIAKELGINVAISSNIVSEGGAKEFNGAGVLMLVEQTELKRNPNFTKDELDRAYKQIFNLKKIIWLPYPTYDDEHMFSDLIADEKGNNNILRSASANGHVDEFCRFIGSNTILLAEITEEEALKSELHRINKDRLDACYNILKQETDTNGNPFEIIRIPTPEPQFFQAIEEEEIIKQINSLKKLFNANKLIDGKDYPNADDLKLLPALSYCNFSIANGVVLMAAYWQEGLPEVIKEKDRLAFEIIKRAFPNREVVQINPLAINFSGGGLHCNTRHIPILIK